MPSEPASPTGAVLTGSNKSFAFPLRLKGIGVTSAAAVATVTVYDNASAGSGTVLAVLSALANTSFALDFGPGVVANNGITIVVTGVGGQAFGYYCPSS